MLGLPMPCQETEAEAEDSFVLYGAQLGLQLLGEASAALGKVLSHILLLLEDEKSGGGEAHCLLGASQTMVLMLNYQTWHTCNLGLHILPRERYQGCRGAESTPILLPPDMGFDHTCV